MLSRTSDRNTPRWRRDGASGVGFSLNTFENLVLGHIFVRSDGGEDCVERSNSQWTVGGDRDAMRRGLLGLQDDMAADLMDLLISPILREVPYERLSAQIAREFHATASTSSRTRRRRIEAGGAESK